MSLKRPLVLFCYVVVMSAPAALRAQYTTPNVTDTPGAEVTILGSTLFINHGLVGVGRIPASSIDSFGETFGSASGLQITGWQKVGVNSYVGTLNILPDRGYNSGDYYSDYAARIQQLAFSLSPHFGTANVCAACPDVPSKLAAQNQISFTSSVTGVKFQYLDGATLKTTTGLDPAGGSKVLFGTTSPYVIDFTGLATPTASGTTLYSNVNKLPLDSEALVLKADGSGYVGDEYGAYVYYFNSSKQIVGVIGLPEAVRPHNPVGTLYFGASGAVNGRRVNQGMEGVALSPDGERLFLLLQSATMQDSNSSQQNRRQTRLFVFDVSTSPTPSAPIAEYALTLPTFRLNGDGGAVNRTAAQSEIIALDHNRLLILSRDGNGLGNSDGNPSVFKSILLADISVGNPTNFAGTSRDAEGGKITSSPGTLANGITPIQWKEAVNLLNSRQLGKFNIALDSGGQVSQLTLSEKWEGMALVPSNDDGSSDDYFLFVANDNDFLTSVGTIQGPGGIVNYDGFDGYAAARQPINSPDGGVNNNDTVFLVYRISIVTRPVATTHQ